MGCLSPSHLATLSITLFIYLYSCLIMSTNCLPTNLMQDFLTSEYLVTQQMTQLTDLVTEFYDVTEKMTMTEGSGHLDDVSKTENQDSSYSYTETKIYDVIKGTETGRFDVATTLRQKSTSKPTLRALGLLQQRSQLSPLGLPVPRPPPSALAQCGMRSPLLGATLRVVGGLEASPNQWPWMVALIDRNTKEIVCGGTLISSQHVITAAHCMDGQNKNNIIVRVGEHNLDIFEPSENDYNIDCLFMHRRYKPVTYVFDIALLKLKTDGNPITFQDEVLPVCLPKKDEFKAGTKCYVTGWGFTSFSDYFYNQPSITLQEGKVPLLSNAECRAAGGIYSLRLNNKMFCAGNLSGKSRTDTCKKDSGGPLVCQAEDGSWKLWGVTSWGDNTFCEEEPITPSPGVYTKVDKFLTWISKRMNSNSCPS